MGFPTEFFPVLFAIPRMAGYLAHWKESLDDPDTKIMRPQQVILKNFSGSFVRFHIPLHLDPFRWWPLIQIPIIACNSNFLFHVSDFSHCCIIISLTMIYRFTPGCGYGIICLWENGWQQRRQIGLVRCLFQMLLGVD